MATVHAEALPIVKAEAIDLAWMARALASSGFDQTPASLSMREIGTGQTGECVRFTVSFADGSPDLCLVGKFPSSNPASFKAAMAGGDYVREVRFYRDLAASTGLSVPHCHVALLDEASGAFVLLLEDMAPARQGDQLSGVNLDQARAVVDQAALLHASHWNDPAIDRLHWVKQTSASNWQLPSPEQVQAACEGFCARFVDQLATHVAPICRRYAERVAHYRALPRPNRCLAHYDFRPDNMMFDTRPDALRPVTVIDWQTLTYACGGDDLAYFVAGALPPETRRRHETELLERYLCGLTAAGVKGYSLAQLQRDYAMGGFRLLATAMGAAMAVRQTERGDRMFLQMIHAAADHIRDHQALDFLD